MARLVEGLGLRGNPFEHYVAELEPDIADYAVKPPYFEAIGARAKNTSSFILFGDRGAGKSATRLTIFKELWREKADGNKVPFAVNMTDFSVAISGRNITSSTEIVLVKEVAFVILESLLTWLSSLDEGDREVYLGALDADESTLCYEMLRDFYLSRPEQKRQRSIREAMVLFNQAFLSKSKLWLERRWEPIARLIGTISEVIIRHYADANASVAQDITATISADRELKVDPILVLRKLVELIAIFDFSGIVILIDKVDETDATSNSADRTAELIHPLLSRVQLMEVDSFSWVFFLWHSIKKIFEGDKYNVRLDKIGHATVAWSDQFFALMLDKRMQFFSNGRMDFSGLFEGSVDVPTIRNELVRVCMRSPREIIRLMDVIIREHDVLHAEKDEILLLDDHSVQGGVDTYVKDRISSIYGDRLLAQIFRLNKTTFSNKDVQLTFKVGAQSARTRIQSWESAGIIKLSGTRAAEGVLGGKPANEYTIVDARIERIMQRQLISYEGEVADEDPEFDPSGGE
ncbi:hypothetical protein IYW40_17560 [Methylocystis sp. H4A]|uniref:P-loop ATPase, Sll1717 family n=1 Tax=Methylocystis sp. H4A TaxID=2785788 RepID=UPI0018C20F05|nr:hypothetical protein [Methylocystis sp. H4A]MBG0803271.1 hypothetical protein [Methylocystis sp. H4A]